MNFEFKPYSDLTLDELYDILKLRSEIFVVEQNCVYNDLDDLDKNATHQFLKKNGEIIACSRLLKPETRFPEYSIGRVVVKSTERRKGLGIQMMIEAKKYMQTVWKAPRIKISAQKYLQEFYLDLEFKVVGDVYLEDGIPHYEMVYEYNLNE